MTSMAWVPMEPVEPRRVMRCGARVSSVRASVRRSRLPPTRAEDPNFMVLVSHELAGVSGCVASPRRRSRYIEDLSAEEAPALSYGAGDFYTYTFLEQILQ